jgi:hypothetical protein
MPYIIDGRTYKVQFANIAAVGAVPSTREINTGSGLGGGGDLSANRTLFILPGGVDDSRLSTTGVVAGTYGAADSVPVLTINAQGRVTAATLAPIVLANYVPTSRTITAGAGLTGGGDLSANRSFAVNFSSTTPEPLGPGSPGVSTAAARGDHVHPAVDLSDTTETQGVLPLSRGGTGNSLSPVVGAIAYSSNDALYLTPTAGTAGQVLVSGGGVAPPFWETLTGTGTVTSVNLTAGTGISVSGGPITTSGSITVVNTAPDQIVALTGAGTTTVTGTYPNFTITSTDSTVGTVTSVNASGGTTGLSFTGGPITTAGTLTLGGTLAVANGGTGATNAADALTNLGAYPASNPAGYTSNVGTVTSVSGTGSVSGLSLSGTVTSTGSLTLGGTLVVTASNFASQTANTVLAAPDGSAGVPTFRSLVAADVPTLNQNTTGTASNVTGIVAVANGGTGASIAATARTNLSAAASGANTDITSIALTTGTISASPVNGTDIVNKAYADSIASGINFHQSVRLATAAALPANTYNNGTSGVGATLTANANGALSVDGVAAVVGNRILVKNEVTQANNGVYTVTQVGNGSTPYILTRATDFDSAGTGVDQIDAGDFFLVTAGSTQSNTSWVQQTPLPITVGTTAIVFSQFAAPVLYSAGTGLSLAGTVFSITNTGVSAATYGSASSVPVIAINAQGQATSVTNTPIAIAASQITSGVLPAANGGTGLSSSGTAGNVLTSNGTAWVSQLPAAGGITYTAVKTSNYTASANDGVQTDTSGGAFTVTLPATPAVGAQVIVVDSAGSWGTTNLIIGRNGSTIEGSATDLICNISSVSVQLVYSGTTWDVYAQLGGAAGGLVTVTGGGTGATTLTANGILLGNGISAVSTTAVGATGQVLVGNTGGAPSWATLSGIGVTSFAGGTTGLTPASATTGAITLAGTLAVANGGTGATSLTSGYLVKGNGTSAVSASVVYDDGTNVGIGTASPAYKLDVNGVARLGAGSPAILAGVGGAFVGGQGELYTISTNTMGLGTTGAASMQLYTNSTERMRIDSSGNVGIGTSTTTTYFTNYTSVRNSGVSGAALGLEVGGQPRLLSVADNSSSYISSYDDNPIIFSVTAGNFAGSTGTERMRISSAGNVGIGTASPNALLALSGAAAAGGILTRITNTDATGFSSINFGDSTETRGQIWVGNLSYASFGGAGSMNYSANSGPHVWYTNYAERARITAGGQLLVGTSTAVNTGGVFSTTGATFSTTATKNSNMHGMTLIATDNANTMTGVWFGTGNGAHWSGIAGVRTDAATDWATHLSFYTHPSALTNINDTNERMRITGDGNVGIGTTSPIAGGFLTVGSGAGSSTAVQYLNAGSGGSALLGRISGSNTWFIGDTTAALGSGTGLINFVYGANPWIVYLNNAERMRIDASGNVGIGTTSPASTSGRNLTIGSVEPSVVLNASSGRSYSIASGGNFQYAQNALCFHDNTAGATRMAIDSGGNVGIGTTIPGAYGGKLTIGDAANAFSNNVLLLTRYATCTLLADGVTAANGAQLDVSWASGGQGPLRFSFSGTERMRLTSAGQLLIGKSLVSAGVVGVENHGADGSIWTTMASAASSVSTLNVYSTGAAAYRFYVTMNGQIYATNTSISGISDVRFKENIRDLDVGLNTILALKPRRFDWKEGKGKNIPDDMGFIAQEVETVMPELIDGWKAGAGEPDDLKSVKAGDLIPVLVKAIQELTARVAQLEGN